MPITNYQLISDRHVDQRLQHTQDQLYAALLANFEAGTPFDAVSVTQLCRQAHVARQTFYRHYGSVGEIVEVMSVRRLYQFLEQLTKLTDIKTEGQRRAVAALVANKQTLQLIFWSRTTETVVQYLTGEILRVLSEQENEAPHQPMLAEMYARNLLNFGQLMLKFPQLSFGELQPLFQKTVPSLASIFG